MQISTVVYYQVVDVRAFEYEVANFHLALEQIAQTTQRNVIRNVPLDKTLTSRDEINGKLRTILDEVTDKWGIKVTRVEFKEITPPRDIQQAMEKQMRAERARRAAILTAEGDKRAAILKSESEKESAISRAAGERQAAVLRDEGEAAAYRNVQAAQIEMTGALFERLENADFSPESLRYLYLKVLPEMAQGPASKPFVVPSKIQDLAASSAPSPAARAWPPMTPRWRRSPAASPPRTARRTAETRSAARRSSSEVRRGTASGREGRYASLVT
jgi:regulator of protease activity HflC (stomatin/prohibitin superfamily)